jgi:cystathionine beta-lyase/cystathionine gamma-synthase
MKDINKKGFETRAVHAGQEPDPSTGAVMTPLYTSSTYKQSSPGVHQGFDYSRSGNPTRKAFEDCMTSLEDGIAGFGFSSGVAAISACVELLKPGDHVIAMDDLYGGTVRLFNEIKIKSQGISVTYVDMTDLRNLDSALTPKTKMIFVETPTNPLLKIVDLEKISEFAKANDILSICDNTFASSYVQKPLNLGIDIVLHSATKYLGGHSDLIAGILVVGKNDEELIARMANIHNSLGPITSSFDSYLILRSLKTLPIRMERHNESAFAIAKELESNNKISKVIYPGLENHPQHEIAKKQMNGYGGIISIEVAGGLEASKVFLEKTKIFTLAESLGGVESLIEHPALMTHASLPAETRERIGISDGLVRLSVGIETLEDLIEDINQALN